MLTFKSKGLRSPGLGLSRAKRGTDVPGEWDLSSHSVRGPLLSLFTPPSRNPPVEGCVEGRGVASRPYPRSPAPCLALFAGRGPPTQQTLSLHVLRMRLASAPPRVRGGGPAAALRAPVGA